MKMIRSLSSHFKLGLLSGLLTLAIASISSAQEKLIIIGGGPNRPAAALKQFSDWSGQEQGRILIITWASEIPMEIAESLMRDFGNQFQGHFGFSLTAPQTFKERQLFLYQLKLATGVFFSGGDQSRIMAAFRDPDGKALQQALEQAYASGKVFGGTSAGTAVMSRHMIMGDPINGTVPLSNGLGFLPEHLIVDQHFSQRNRVARLLQAQDQAGTFFAIGIDEDTALVVLNRRESRVLGDHQVRIFKGHSSAVEEISLKSGDVWVFPPPPAR